MSDKLKQAKAEKEAYDKVYQEVWDEEVTDFDELRYMKFFKAGIEHAKERTDSEEVERLKAELSESVELLARQSPLYWCISGDSETASQFEKEVFAFLSKHKEQS